VEKGDGDRIVAKLDAVLWRGQAEKVEARLAESDQRLAGGVEIRARGQVGFYPPGGRLQLVVREVDPFFSLGLLERRRQETLASLTAAGLLETNKAQPLPILPLRVGLVTSEGSAAYHDFLSSLSARGYGFQVLFVHSAVQGQSAEAGIVSALEALAGEGPDCVALIRGGGSRTDLAVFDSRVVAEAVATAPFPVLTGLGHEIDRSIADVVSHTALKTPTAVAEWLVERVAESERRLAEVAALLSRSSLKRIQGERERMLRAEPRVKLAGHRVRVTAERLGAITEALSRQLRQRLVRELARNEETGRRLAEASRRAVARQAREPELLAQRLLREAGSRIREAGRGVDARARLVEQLSPRRVLERGFSLTRNDKGELVRSAWTVRTGDLIVTELAHGQLTSRVEPES
jgi:exodeoxyribonuclease VII large subunit